MKGSKWTAIWILALVIISVPGLARAYEIKYLRVQHRVYQGGLEINRLMFGITSKGKFVTKDKMTSVALYGPDGKRLSLADSFFSGTYKERDGLYDADAEEWDYGSLQFHTTSFYRANINTDRLQAGQYRLVITYDGKSLGKTWEFKGLLRMPIPQSTTFKIRMNTHGDFIATWTPPYKPSQDLPTRGTSVRAIIDSYKNDTWIGEVYVKIPTRMGKVVVPKELVTKLKKQGDAFTMAVQLRSDDDCNRTYSDQWGITFE